MNVSLRPEIEAYLREKVASGQFTDMDDALNGALKSLRDQERLTDYDVAFLRRAMQGELDQLDRGEGEPWDASDLKEHVARFSGGRSSNTGT